VRGPRHGPGETRVRRTYGDGLGTAVRGCDSSHDRGARVRSALVVRKSQEHRHVRPASSGPQCRQQCLCHLNHDHIFDCQRALGSRRESGREIFSSILPWQVGGAASTVLSFRRGTRDQPVRCDGERVRFEGEPQSSGPGLKPSGPLGFSWGWKPQGFHPETERSSAKELVSWLSRHGRDEFSRDLQRFSSSRAESESPSIVPTGLEAFLAPFPALRYASCRANYNRRSAAQDLAQAVTSPAESLRQRLRSPDVSWVFPGDSLGRARDEF
jgi:hypothetical protein